MGGLRGEAHGVELHGVEAQGSHSLGLARGKASQARRKRRVQGFRV